MMTRSIVGFLNMKHGLSWRSINLASRYSPLSHVISQLIKILRIGPSWGTSPSIERAPCTKNIFSISVDGALREARVTIRDKAQMRSTFHAFKPRGTSLEEGKIQGALLGASSSKEQALLGFCESAFSKLSLGSEGVVLNAKQSA
jgi:hypothetical protein